MVIVGIDASLTCTGIAVFGGPRVKTTQIKGGKLRGPARLCAMRDELLGVLEYSRPGLAVVEGYSFGSRNGREAQGEWGGLIRTALWLRWIPYLVVPPTTLKLYASGKGNTPDLIAAVRKRWRFKTTSDDIADAFALMQLGVELATAVAKPTTDFAKIVEGCELFATPAATIRKTLRAVPKNGPLQSKR